MLVEAADTPDSERFLNRNERRQYNGVASAKSHEGQ